VLSPADHIVQLEHVVRQQMAVIDQLRTENQRLLDWIMGEGPDALLALQRVYSDPKTNENNVIKAAASALPFERGKPAQVVIEVDFRERVRNARLRQLELDKAEWARQDAAKLAPTILGHDGGPEADPAA
jgi:hypothetical protein